MKKETTDETEPIFATKDYNQFKDIVGNRPVNNVHVNKLIASITKTNLLAANPIIVAPDMTVLDGQHRLVAAKALHLPIYYTFASGGLETIQLLNGTVKTWQIKDYLESYCALGRPNYLAFRQFITDHSLSAQAGLLLLVGNNGEGTYRLFRSGNLTFDVVALERATAMADDLDELSQYCDVKNPSAYVSNPIFLKAFQIIYDKGKMPEIIRKLNLGKMKDPKPLKKLGTVVAYLRQFEDIFNYNSREAERLY